MIIELQEKKHIQITRLTINKLIDSFITKIQNTIIDEKKNNVLIFVSILPSLKNLISRQFRLQIARRDELKCEKNYLQSLIVWEVELWILKLPAVFLLSSETLLISRMSFPCNQMVMAMVTSYV